MLGTQLFIHTQTDRADKSLGSRHIQCAYYLESLQILKSGRHDGACLLLLSAVSRRQDTADKSRREISPFTKAGLT